MDLMCIRTKKVEQLETVAKLSTVQLVECDEYIRLAMCVEQYVNNPSEDSFNKLKEQLAICTTHFPKFNNSRQTLIATLLSTGYMVQNTPPTNPPDEPKKEPEVTLIDETQNMKAKDNVYSFFTKKKVDFPKEK